MLDLDAARAARREALGDAPEFVFGGKTRSLPVELPYAAAMAFNREEIDAGLVHLLGAEVYDELIEQKLSQEDLNELLKWALAEYTGDKVDDEADSATEVTKKGSAQGKGSRSKS